MEKFKFDLFTLCIIGILCFFTRSIFRLVQNRLEENGGIAGIVRNDLRPTREQPAEEQKPKEDPKKRRLFRRRTKEEQKPKEERKKWQPRNVGELTSNYGVYGELWRRCTRRENLLATVGEMVLIIGASFGMAWLCNYSNGGVDLYMTTFMTVMYVLVVLVLFARCVDGARGIYLPCCVMILCGIALATLLHLSPMAAVASNHIGPPDDSVKFQVIALILGLAAFPLIRMVCQAKNRSAWVIILNLVIIGMYILLRVVGKEINGAKNWIIIGGFSFQVSEVTKTLSAAAFALTLTNGRMSEKARFWWTTFTMAVNGLFLLISNEFGTLLVLCVVYVGLCLVYQKKLGRLITVIVAASIVAACGLTIAYRCYYITPKKAPMTVQVTAITEESPAFAKNHTYTPVEDWEAPEKEKKPAAQTEFYIKAGGYYKKFQDRFLVFVDQEKVDMEKEGYQWKMAREALVISDWMGSPYDVAVPVARSDFIFSYLIVRLGMLFGFGILLMLAIMICVGTIRSLKNTSPGEASVSLAFVLTMVGQSLIAAASATGNFAIVGIPFVFLAYGGSATMMNYVMLIFMIYATRRETLDADRLIISRREEA